jgi:hypothetical protein
LASAEAGAFVLFASDVCLFAFSVLPFLALPCDACEALKSGSFEWDFSGLVKYSLRKADSRALAHSKII